MLLLPALAAALMPHAPPALASRASVSRATRPVMMPEASDAVVQSVFVESHANLLPLMTLADAEGLVTSITSLSPVAQAIYCATCRASNRLDPPRPKPNPNPIPSPAPDAGLCAQTRSAWALCWPACRPPR